MKEKIVQATQIMGQKNLDCWLMLARETGTLGNVDPSLDLLLPTSIVGLTAFLLTKEGRFYAIAANYDAYNLSSTDLFCQVIGYEYSIEEEFLRLLQVLDPFSIGINYSNDDFVADGITYGLFLWLQELLQDTPYGQRLCSAEELAMALRSQKTPREVEKIQKACETTREIWKALDDFIQPGVTEREAMEFIHRQCDERGVATGWDRRWCPGITSGPHSVAGHNAPSDKIVVEAGTLFSMDFGVKQDHYVSDLQRTWYVPGEGKKTPPQEVLEAQKTLWEAVNGAREAMKPGVRGYEIDAIARRIIVEAGYPEYMHGLGHQVGRSAHDGGVVLGPKEWPRYRKKAAGVLSVGNVFTIEPGIETSIGRYGAEEMVVVREDGAEFLLNPQREIWTFGQGEVS